VLQTSSAVAMITLYSSKFRVQRPLLALTATTRLLLTYVTSNESIIFSMIGKYVEYLVVAEEYEIV
jgi:hypothetical protein